MASRTFGQPDGWKSFTVPEGITQVTITAEGGSSGGRAGGKAGGTFKCDPGTTLWVAVGGAGKQAQGRNGGGRAPGGGGKGGDGNGSGDGGNGGGGATVVRLGTADGTILVVAGGAGGTSGDGGSGGLGGADAGQDGGIGNAGNGTIFPARGGSTTNPGSGGSSSGGKKYAGADADKGKLGQGGTGGSVNAGRSHGGGGGGGGYTAGGGGPASAVQNNPGGAPTRQFPAGGGGGGANYVHDLMTGRFSSRGGAAGGDGVVVLEWSDTPFVNNPPTAPTNVTINGEPESPDMTTKSMGTVVIGADIDDPDIGQQVRLMLLIGYKTPEGNPVEWQMVTAPTEQSANEFGQSAESVTHTLTLTGLQLNTNYTGRLYTIDEKGQISGSFRSAGGRPALDFVEGYQSISFWTNRPPYAPTLDTPAENTQVDVGTDIDFSWIYGDPDQGETQGAWHLRYRTAATPTQSAGPWIDRSAVSATEAVTLPADLFRGNTNYEWSVRTRDPEGSWGPWAAAHSFFVQADATPPQLLSPINDVAVETGSAQTFGWLFRDSNSDVSQTNADLRYRVFGSDEWTVLYGDPDPGTPGSAGSWPLAALDLRDYLHYEWQVRTYTSVGGLVSDWSHSQSFWTIPKAGSGLSSPIVTTPRIQPPLGSGHNRVWVYDRGGKIPRGELTNLSQVQWMRRRDDVGYCNVTIDNFDDDLLRLLGQSHTWQHELVVFRESGGRTERVFEGPLTFKQDSYDRFRLQALDCMGYLKRRVIRQGYNDSYQIIDGVQVGLRTVVERAAQLVKNALAYDDPNLIPYLTTIVAGSDARQSRVVPDFSKSVFDEIDSLAADSGLDYTTVGRRIVLWDTHNPIGKLPELGNGDISTFPVLTEYGMQGATLYAVTDGSGVYGLATRGEGLNGVSPLYGALEMVASAYGVLEGEVVDNSTLTEAQLEALQRTYAEQSERNIAHRYPVPIEVRVPEGARLSPEVNIGINQLVPGVWIPVRAKSRLMEIAQWQKLDQVMVTEDKSGEQVTVIMNPAPNGGQDLDAEPGDSTGGE